MKMPITEAWAKLDDKDGRTVGWHPLLAHCADVGASAEALMQHTVLGRRLACLAGIDALSAPHIARLSALCALHDAGKVNNGFQARAVGGPIVGHVREVLGLFSRGKLHSPIGEQVVKALDLFTLVPWFEGEQLLPMLYAALAHHGKPWRPDECSTQATSGIWTSSRSNDPFATLEILSAAVRQWFPEAFEPKVPPLKTPAAFQHAFHGLVMLADWLGSDERLFRFQKEDDPAERMPFARQAAKEAVDAIGLCMDTARSVLVGVPAFDSVSEYAPRPAQAAVQSLTVGAFSSLAILESETGSGKTEAALLHYMKLFERGLVDGLYFALPTRTAATQLHRRVVLAMQRAFGELAPPVTLAVPGYLQVDERSGQHLPGFHVLWDEQEGRDSRWWARGWAAEHAKRYLAGAVVVGTIDQVLLSALAVKHANMRSTALLRQLLIVDEVHASDAYMNRLLEFVLDHHLRAGGHAFLMSATLGSRAVHRFLRSLEPTAMTLPQATQLGYPLLTVADFSQGAGSEPGTGHQKLVRRIDLTEASEASTPQKAVEVGCVAEMGLPEAVAARAVAAMRAGARVLVIRNTVSSCLATQTAVEGLLAVDELGPMRCAGRYVPHHSRYAAPDRKLLDAAVEQAVGKAEPRTAALVVATQTVQQSLDLDADLLITDLCPMDVLLQRIGRLHRHSSTRPPGFERPRTVVLVPVNRDLTVGIRKDGEASLGNALGTVYDDLFVLESTWRTLERAPVLEIPRMNRALIEQTTHPDVYSALEVESADWLKHRQYLEGLSSSHRVQAQMLRVERGKEFPDCAYAELDLRRSTRLGEQTQIAKLPVPVTSPLGSLLTEVSIPFFLLRQTVEDAIAEAVEVHDDHFTFVVAGVSFRYDRLGLQVTS